MPQCRNKLVDKNALLISLLCVSKMIKIIKVLKKISCNLLILWIIYPGWGRERNFLEESIIFSLIFFAKKYIILKKHQMLCKSQSNINYSLCMCGK